MEWGWDGGGREVKSGVPWRSGDEMEVGMGWRWSDGSDGGGVRD